MSFYFGYKVMYEWAWNYFVETEAKALVGCKHCGTHFRCTRLSELYRHFMDHHWYNLRHRVRINRCLGIEWVHPDQTWLLDQFSEYVHMAICKCCGDIVNFRHPIALVSHLLNHDITEDNPNHMIADSKPKSNIVEISCTNKKTNAYEKYIKATKRKGQPLQCYENCKLHDKDKLPFKVTVVKNLKEIDKTLE